jgi:hypothetical protein
MVALALFAAEESRASWPSYLAFALLALGLIAVVWHNQRARKRARDAAREPDEPT